jgi:transcriptional regulator with XRE-family HTH domain
LKQKNEQKTLLINYLIFPLQTTAMRNNQIQNQIKSLNKQGIKTKEIAGIVGYSYSYIQNVKNGVHRPSSKMRKRFQDTFSFEVAVARDLREENEMLRDKVFELQQRLYQVSCLAQVK